MVVTKRIAILLTFCLTMLWQCYGCSKSGPGSDVNDGDLPSEMTEVDVTMFKMSAKDDHDMIQKAIDYASSKRIFKVIIPDGIYQISAASVTGQPGILLRDNIHLTLASGAVLQAIPNSVGNYNMLRIHNVSNVTVEGGAFIGERNEHIGTSGEWGMGIDIRNSSNIEIKGTKISDCWGDGIYIAGGSKNILLDDIVCDNNRRQGVSVINCEGLIIKNSTFKNTNGAAPAAGIDLEPNEGDKASKIQILNCRFENNSGLGLHMYGRYGPVTDVLVKDCIIDNNPVGLSLRYEGINNVNIENVQILNSRTEGFRIFDGSHTVSAKNVSVSQSPGNNAVRIADGKDVELTDIEVESFVTGFRIDNSENVQIRDAKLTSGTLYGFRLTGTDNSTFQGNTVSSIGSYPIFLASSNDNTFLDNTLSGENCSTTDNLYAQITLEGTSSRNTFSGNKATGVTHTNKPKHVVWLYSNTFQNTFAENTFEVGSYVTSTVQDDSNGQNQIN